MPSLEPVPASGEVGILGEHAAGAGSRSSSEAAPLLAALFRRSTGVSAGTIAELDDTAADGACASAAFSGEASSFVASSSNGRSATSSTTMSENILRLTSILHLAHLFSSGLGNGAARALLGDSFGEIGEAGEGRGERLELAAIDDSPHRVRLVVPDVTQAAMEIALVVQCAAHPELAEHRGQLLLASVENACQLLVDSRSVVGW